MPRPTFHPGKLYTTEIGALQRVLRFSQQDTRFTEQERAEIANAVATLQNTLSNAQSRSFGARLTTKGKS